MKTFSTEIISAARNMLLTKRKLKYVLALALCLGTTIRPCLALTNILIGAVFSEDPGMNCINGTVEVEAFKLAIKSINEDSVYNRKVKFQPLIRCADPSDDFDNIDKVNSLLRSNISILIGPMATSAVVATQPLCNKARVPQIAPLTSLETVQMDQDQPGYLLRMSPTEEMKSNVISDVVKYFQWQTMAVLGYQDREASRGQSAFRLLAYENEWDVVLASLFPPSKKGIHPGMALRRLEQARTRLAVVFCPAWAINPLMSKANGKRQINMKTWTWIFSDLGNSKYDIIGSHSSDVPHYMRGLLGIRPSIGKGARYTDFKQEWRQVMPNKSITVSMGRIYDSVLVAAEGVKRAMDDGVTVSSSVNYLGFCNHTQNQPENLFGKELAKHLNKIKIEGVMGDIQANDPDSAGTSFFDVINLRGTGEVKVGEWNATKGLHMYDHEKPIWASGLTKKPSDIPNYLANETLNITTIEAPPFVIVTGDSSGNGTSKLEGLCIDILEEIRKELGFNYHIYLAPDGKFGVRDKLTGEWNGVVREIIDGRAHVSIAPMTISSDRQAVLDFTHPYMTFGLAFMMRVKEVKANYFRFLLPFDKFLWIAICALVMVMGFLVWTCSVLSPRGYYGRCAQARPSEKLKPEVLQQSETLSLNNSIWSSWKAYVRQGAEHPTSFSGRMTVSVFWFAVMIINATYTANLAAHLTVSRMQTPIETIGDLARQTLIEYGTLKDSQLQTFFKKTDVPSYLVMGQFMEQHNTWMPSFDAAINRTMDSDFAFISDRPILDFVSRQREMCGKLKVIGGFGNTYGYGFAFQLNSPYTALFNMALFRLQKDFIISALTHKWTKVKAKCEMIDNLEEQEQQGNKVQMITFQSMLGVFMLLGISGLLGFLIMIIEWIYASAKDSGKGIKGRRTCCQAFGARLLQTLKDIFCHGRPKAQHSRENLSGEEEPCVVGDYEVSL